jgi:hypothetical protein
MTKADPLLRHSQEDIEFLLQRADCAGRCSFGGDRWTGMSSNAIVALAYGGRQICMPSDRDDYAACVRTVRRLPKHRRTPQVMAALWRAREAYLQGHPQDRSALARREEKLRWQEEQRMKWERRQRRRRA